MATPLQYSCLENPMDRGAWWAAVHGVTKSWTRLSDLAATQRCVVRFTQGQHEAEATVSTFILGDGTGGEWGVRPSETGPVCTSSKGQITVAL